jgi:hypothetical protein
VIARRARLLLPVVGVLWGAATGVAGDLPPEATATAPSEATANPPAEVAEATEATEATEETDAFERAWTTFQARLEEAGDGLGEVIRTEAETLADVAVEMYVEGETDVALTLLGEAMALVDTEGA